MSLVSVRLGRRDPVRRRAATSTSVAAGSGLRTMADLPTGGRARIVAVHEDADPAVARRLVDLGFAPGAEVAMVRKAPMADPVVYRVAGYDLALRRVQARCLLVAPSDGTVPGTLG